MLFINHNTLISKLNKYIPGLPRSLFTFDAHPHFTLELHLVSAPILIHVFTGVTTVTIIIYAVISTV